MEVAQPYTSLSKPTERCINPLQTGSGLPVVAALAQGLPISLIPEQFWIAPVWDDMVDHGCRLQFTLGEALDAERIAAEKGSSGIAPLAVIASGRSPATQAFATQPNMIFAVHLALFAEPRAPGEAAGPFRFHGHEVHLVSSAGAYRRSCIHGRHRRSRCSAAPSGGSFPGLPGSPLRACPA